MRIRYRKTRQEGILESVQRFLHPTNGARYKVILDEKEHQWMVVDDMSDLIAASGHRVHPVKLRLDARNALTELGIEILNDVRKPRSKQKSEEVV